MKGSTVLMKCLENQDVDKIFGYPGGGVIDMYDSLAYSSIDHILARHEQAGVHAADGYARVTGKPGVCFATAGPGATNVVTGIATAYMDSVPMVIITGQVPQFQLGSDAFQEADITGITMPVTKHSYLVKDLKDLPRIINEAFHIASTGRPQPVLVDITKDILKEEIDENKLNLGDTSVDLPGYKPVYKGHPMQIQKAVKKLKNADKPVIIAGGGIQNARAHQELKELAENLNIPVATTLMGKAEFPRDHELSLGMMGMHGLVTANMTVSKADVVLAVGVRFSDRTFGSFQSFQEGKEIIHIDIDPAEIDKNVNADLPIVGDARNILSEMNSKISKLTVTTKDSMSDSDSTFGNQVSGGETSAYPYRSRPWHEELAQQWLEEDKKINNNKQGLTPYKVIKSLSNKYQELDTEFMVTTDVGQHQMWVAQHFDGLKPGTFISSGGLGTMGYGFPAALGAKAGRPDMDCLSFVGDGSFQMTMQELALIKKYNLPVKIIMLNNGCLGMVRQWQELFYEKNYSEVNLDVNPDFVQLVGAYGIKGIRLADPNDLESVVDEIAETDGPLFVEIKVCTGENVFPFVPPGQPITNIIKEGF